MPTRFRLDHVVFFGRTEHDYEEMFAFDLASLRGQRVLDCPSGPDAFVADANAAGIDAVGCDPVYDGTPEAIFARARGDIELCIGNLQRVRDEYPTLDIDAFRLAKLDALERFARDFTAPRAHERYFPAALPRLPFADGSFDLVLSAHLLFCYAAPEFGGVLPDSPFDLDWHRAAVAELVRVARGEVRLYPTNGGLDVDVHPFAAALVDDLRRRRDVAVSFHDSRYAEGVPGANRFLTIRRVR